jgi:hypothetical protein
MPQQTVYIRQADLAKWKALSNKADFISKHLNDEPEPEYIEKPEKRGSGSIQEQLAELGLLYDPTVSGMAWNAESEQYVKYKIVDGEVIL